MHTVKLTWKCPDCNMVAEINTDNDNIELHPDYQALEYLEKIKTTHTWTNHHTWTNRKEL